MSERLPARPWPPSPTACLVRGFIPARPPTPTDGLIHGQPGPRPELHPAGRRGLSMADLVHGWSCSRPAPRLAHGRPSPQTSTPTSDLVYGLNLASSPVCVHDRSRQLPALAPARAPSCSSPLPINLLDPDTIQPTTLDPNERRETSLLSHPGDSGMEPRLNFGLLRRQQKRADAAMGIDLGLSLKM